MRVVREEYIVDPEKPRILLNDERVDLSGGVLVKCGRNDTSGGNEDGAVNAGSEADGFALVADPRFNGALDGSGLGSEWGRVLQIAEGKRCACNSGLQASGHQEEAGRGTGLEGCDGLAGGVGLETEGGLAGFLRIGEDTALGRSVKRDGEVRDGLSARRNHGDSEGTNAAGGDDESSGRELLLANDEFRLGGGESEGAEKEEGGRDQEAHRTGTMVRSKPGGDKGKYERLGGLLDGLLLRRFEDFVDFADGGRDVEDVGLGA